MPRTPWTPLPGSTTTGCCGHGEDDDRHAEPGLVELARRACRPLTRPWSRASTMTTSGRCSEIRPSTLSPSLTTSSSLIALLGRSSSPRTYWATCGTSSTTRRRIWSGIGPTLPRGHAHAALRRWSCPGQPGGAGTSLPGCAAATGGTTGGGPPARPAPRPRPAGSARSRRRASRPPGRRPPRTRRARRRSTRRRRSTPDPADGRLARARPPRRSSSGRRTPSTAS